jgi:hypothetical protein
MPVMVVGIKEIVPVTNTIFVAISKQAGNAKRCSIWKKNAMPKSDSGK